MSFGSGQVLAHLPADEAAEGLRALTGEIVSCRRCPRLVAHRERIGETKRASYLQWDYWAKPVPSFGDPAASLMVLGLAPAAHGGNRTGRVFTGDASATFLIKAMYAAGLVAETRTLIARYGAGFDALRSIGYAEAARVVAGECDEASALEQTQLATHRLVRQQATWFRRDDERIEWRDGADLDGLVATVEAAARAPVR